MLKILIPVSTFLLVNFAFATNSDSGIHDKSKKSNEIDEISNKFLDMNSYFINDSTSLSFVNNFQLFEQDWNQLAHPVFWKKIIGLSADSCVINIGDSRTIIEIQSLKDWNAQTDTQKDAYRDSVRLAHNLSKSARILVTSGKQNFYTFDNILADISRGVEVFNLQEVDPWYAQAILMIESPGKLAKSSVGAYGSFQLMPDVARKFGLKVNKTIDERADFDKSAKAASQLIETVCIPYAKSILDNYSISYEENELWFRLFVLHVYHAGAYNVAGVVEKISPEVGGQNLIRQMWVTEARSFRNASQNYSQLALAAMMVLDELIQQQEYICQSDF